MRTAASRRRSSTPVAEISLTCTSGSRTTLVAASRPCITRGSPGSTYWNYVCVTEITIRVSDPRVPGCEDEPDLPGCQVVVLSLGRGIAVRQVQTAGTTEGLTTGGAPFGGSRLEPRLDFSRTELITGKNIPDHRWLYWCPANARWRARSRGRGLGSPQLLVCDDA